MSGLYTPPANDWLTTYESSMYQNVGDDVLYIKPDTIPRPIAPTSPDTFTPYK